VPVFIEQALATVITMIGTMMVSGIGPQAVSGVALVDSINFLLMNVFTSIATGVTVVVSQFIGAGNIDRAGRSGMQAIVVSVEAAAILGTLMIIFARQILHALFGGAEADVIDAAQIFLTASSISFPFLALYSTAAGIARAAGDSKSPMVASLAANIAYILVAVILIKGLGFGVIGIGIGIGVSRVISSLVMYFKLARNPMISLDRFSLKLSGEILGPIIKIALPVGADSFLFNIGKIIVQVFMSGMGTAALAAYSITSSLAGFINLPGNAAGIVSMTVIGQTYGAGKIRETMRYMKKLTAASMALLLLACTLMLIFIEPLIGLYQPVEESIPIALRSLRMVLIASPLLWVPAFVTPNMLRSTGDTTFPMVVSVISMFTLRVACAWVFGVYLGWGVFGIWFSMLTDWVGRSLFYVPRMLSGRWCKDYKERVKAEELQPAVPAADAPL
jgi:putative MATE family efflux protein